MGASGEDVEVLGNVGGGVSPGNGNRSEVDEPFCAGAQGEEDLSTLPADSSEADDEGLVFPADSVVGHGETAGC